MALRFDVSLLAGRLGAAIDWLLARPETARLAIGLCGSDSGAAAALVAAAARPALVQAVVARGGRPDLAGPALAQVRAPTLLIVGGKDQVVIELNRQALVALGGRGHLVVIPRASHLFDEPGALEEVAALARRFFGAHLALAGTEPRILDS
jgi:putative phosphoribosyl transferase